MLHKAIYQLGVSFRSPEIISRYKLLKESELWNLDELQYYQLQELKRILNIAYERSPFYKNLYDEVGIKPEDIRSLEDIKKLPIVSKRDLVLNNASIQNRDGYRKLFYSETSGSTGEPLVIYRHSEWDAATRAAQLRGYSWYGVSPWENNGYLWGFSFDLKKKIKTKLLDLLLNRFRLFSYSEDEIEKFLNRVKSAAYLEGYSSMIYEVAKKININKNKDKIFKLKMIKGTSEKIFDSYQYEVEKAFGTKMINEYGACESGLIAFECPCGSMHITMENVIVEEEDGEIIITNLVSDSFPIIRYKLGDAVKLNLDIECECGMKHQAISEVVGRIGKVIYGRTSSYPSLTLYYVFKNFISKYNIILNYQAIQDEKGKLIINLEQDIDTEIENALINEFKIYFGNDIDILIIPLGLKRDNTRKFKDFISNICY